jgi:hypothetical protein
MGTSQRGQLPPDLLAGQRRFRAWRERRKLGCRIPQTLWQMAIRLAECHGVSRTSTALGLDYYGLKKRAQGAAAPPRSSGPAFLELTPPVLVSKQCRLELDNGVLAANVQKPSARCWAGWEAGRRRVGNGSARGGYGSLAG